MRCSRCERSAWVNRAWRRSSHQPLSHSRRQTITLYPGAQHRGRPESLDSRLSLPISIVGCPPRGAFSCLDSERESTRPHSLGPRTVRPASRDNLTGGRATEMPPSSAWPPDDAAAQQAGHEKKTWSTPRVFTVHGPCKSFFAPPRRRPHAAGHWPFRKEGAGPNAPQAHHGSMEARCWLINGTIATDRNMATHGPSPDLTAKSDQSPSRASL